MEVLTPREDEMKLLLYEVYRDDGAFDVHRNGPSRSGAKERRNNGQIFRDPTHTDRIANVHTHASTNK